jgi:hypothetical protein
MREIYYIFQDKKEEEEKKPKPPGWSTSHIWSRGWLDSHRWWPATPDWYVSGLRRFIACRLVGNIQVFS